MTVADLPTANAEGFELIGSHLSPHKAHAFQAARACCSSRAAARACGSGTSRAATTSTAAARAACSTSATGRSSRSTR